MHLILTLITVGAPASPMGEAPHAESVVPPAEDLRALIAGAGSTQDHDGGDLVVILDRSRVAVEQSGLAHYRRRRVFKVLTEAGATALKSLRFDYDPTSNLVELEAARIYRRPEPAAGEPPQPVAIGAARVRDLPQPQHGIFWGPRMKVLSVPRLEIGDALEVETYTKGFIIAYLGGNGGGSDDERFIPPMRGHFYDIVLFGDAPWPTLERHYAVTLPKEKPLQLEVYNGEVHSSVSFDDKTTTYAFWKKNLPPHKPEARAADASDYLPKVVMATVKDWQEKSRWFARVNENQFAANEAIQAKVAEITRGTKNDEEKIAAILHWTAQEIRYSGISMGKGEGYTLHSGAMTFHDRAGVCKDIAGMSITLLRAAGFTSYPAMTMAGARVERIPADQFNHCVVAVKRPEGYRMIDPTWAPFSAELWSSAEREQHYVIGTPEGEDLMMTSNLPPTHNQMQIKAESRLDADGNLESDVIVTGTGYLEDRLRRLVAYRSVDELGPAVAGMLGRVKAGATLMELRFSNHRALNEPFRVELKYRVPGYANIGSGVMRTGLPVSKHLLGNQRLADWLSATESDTRSSAVWLRCPQQLRFEERLRVPAGFRLLGPPVDEQVETKMGAVRATLEQNGDVLHLREEVLIRQRNIAPEDYAPLKKVADTFRDFSQRRFFLAREPQGD